MGRKDEGNGVKVDKDAVAEKSKAKKGSRSGGQNNEPAPPVQPIESRAHFCS